MNTVLFDLDGTLLPLNHEEFLTQYFGLIAKKFSSSPYHYNAEKLLQGVKKGTYAMIKNDGMVTNLERFWEAFASDMGQDVKAYVKDFDAFYENEFLQLKRWTKPNPFASKCVRELKEKGYTVVAATNPLLPKPATAARLSWAGVHYDDFKWVTTYDNSRYCKPNIAYYEEVLRTIDKEPKECLMVGNDVQEDMCVASLGVKTYLVTDCLLNRDNTDISIYKHGSFEDFSKEVEGMPAARV